MSAHNLATSPPYVLDGFASSIASLFGLGAPLELSGTGALGWGRPLLVALVAASIWVWRTPTRRWILVALAVGITFWFTTAGNFGFGRLPTASRYQYVGAVFVLLIAGEIAAGWRPGWRAILATFAVAGAAALSNLAILHDGYLTLTGRSTVVRGGLGGLEVAADRVNPDFVLTPANSDFFYLSQVTAGPYLSASAKFGSPAYSQSELASAPESPGKPPTRCSPRPCPSASGRARAPSGGAPPRVVGPAGALVDEYGLYDAATGCRPGTRPHAAAWRRRPEDAPGLAAELLLRRFASGFFPASAGTLRGTASLVIPTDRSSRPWQLQILAPGRVTVCGGPPV